MQAYAHIVYIRSVRDLAGVIRHERHKQGLTQAQLGDLVGVTRAWVSAIEQGKSTAEVALVLRTLTALGLVANVVESGQLHGGVDLDELLG
jgi:y4mF family transcriptional regulator